RERPADMSTAGKNTGGVSEEELLRMLKALKKQLSATKREYFSHSGVVTDSVVLPDDKARLRAVVELAKLHGLFPRRGEGQARDQYDRSERPVINLVMPSLERNAACTGNEG
ncbi:MAG TPA: hypothetical protein VLY23_08220, partial [Candidatus Acidoferrum sp.]|nr:hypothetical protein [Candidatus Acidoferrum sp.]